MNIFLVANTDWYLYNFRRSLAAYLHTRGHQVTFVSPRGRFAEMLQNMGYPWREWSVGRKSSGPGEILAIQRLTQLYQRERPDLVHHFTIKPALYGAIAAKVAHVPYVVTAITGLGYVFMQNGLKARLLRQIVLLLYQSALHHPNQVIIFENRYDRMFFERMKLVKPDSGRIIEGAGVDVDYFQPLPEPDGGIPLAILPARMLWDKGVGTAVEAARLLKTNNCPLRLALVGPTDPGNPANIPETTLRGWVEEGIVEWWGFQEDMRQVYQRSNIVLLPSLGEGIPTVLIEAAACGRAIIATDVPGCRDVVTHAETGLLVPPNDAVALAGALQQLAGTPTLRQKLGSAGRARTVARFSNEQVNRETLQAYEELTSTLS
jgi:glycosyltransferase involved in cell wall biosynthesis